MPPRWFTEPLSMGQVTSRDPYDLRPGELQQATGFWYPPNDTRLTMLRGRTLFGDTASAAEIQGLAVCEFDTQPDKVVALSGTSLYSATAGASGSFASAKTGLTSGANSLGAAHFNDRWYLVNGLDRMQVFESDGSVRDAGISKGFGGPTITTSTGSASVLNPAVPNGVSGPIAGDVYYFEASYKASVAKVWTGSGWTGAAATRQLQMTFWGDVRGWDPWPGAQVYTLTIEVSEDYDQATPTWASVYSAQFDTRSPNTALQYEVTADPDNIAVRTTITHDSGQNSELPLFAFDGLMELTSGTGATAPAADTTWWYGVAEYNEDTGFQGVVNDLTEVEITNASGHNQCSLDLSILTAKTGTTHWKLYRTPGILTANKPTSVPLDQLGELAMLEVSQTTYVDYFSIGSVGSPGYGYYFQPEQIYEMLEYRVSDQDTGLIRDHIYAAPPLLSQVVAYRGHLVGIERRTPFGGPNADGTQPTDNWGRRLYYSMPGFPEYWPALYVLDRIPMPQNDQLQALVPLGEMLILGAKETILRVDGLPLVVNGQFIPGSAHQIPGTFGVTGEKAMAAYSTQGMARVAWISYNGVWATNGNVVERISDDMDWGEFEGFNKTDWGLFWDPERFLLIMTYSSTAGGANDRYATFHMHPSQHKDGKPKVTWGHYGAFNDMAHALVGATGYLYSAHTSDGKVYRERAGYSDASNTYNSDGDIPYIAQTRRLEAEGHEWSVLAARLGHTAVGAGQEITVDWDTGRLDSSSRRTQQVSVANHERTLFDIARGGEWHEGTFTFTTKTLGGSLLDLRLQTRILSSVGRVGVG